MVRKCRVCGCTDNDCIQCIEAQGFPCKWTGEDICSRCGSAVSLSWEEQQIIKSCLKMEIEFDFHYGFKEFQMATGVKDSFKELFEESGQKHKALYKRFSRIPEYWARADIIKHFPQRK